MRQAVAFSILLAFVYLGFGGGTAWAAVFTVLCVTFFVTVVHRFVLLAGATSFFCWYSLDLLPITRELSKWYAGSSSFSLAILAALAGAAFWICLAGRPLLKDELPRA